MTTSRKTLDTVFTEFEAFLAAQGRPTAICWVWGEQVRLRRGTVYVGPEVARRGEIEAAFNSSDAREFGVELRAVAHLSACTIACIVVPRCAREAEELRIRTVKYTCPSTLRRAKRILSVVHWKWIRWLTVQGSAMGIPPRERVDPKRPQQG